MTILITGAAGCIGTNLSLTLLSEGHRVIGIDNFITGQRKNADLLSKKKQFIFIEHDIVKPLPTLPKTIHQIFHLACPTGVPNLITLAEEMITTCTNGTFNVLELAKNCKSRLLFTSSSEVYGNPQTSPQTESYTGNVHPTGVRSPYEEGKRAAEAIIAMYVRKYAVNARIVRIFNTYGPYMNPSDTRVVPTFLKQALAGKPLTIQGDGAQKRTFCYVDDLVTGLLIAMKNGKPGNVYNLGSDTQMTVRDLAEEIIKTVGSKSTIKNISRPPHDHESRLPDLTAIRALGWKQTTTLQEGLLSSVKYI